MVRRKSAYLGCLLAVFWGVVGVGCTSASLEETGSAQVVSTLHQALGVGDVTRVELTVSGAGMDPRMEALTRTGNQWGGVLHKLPVGPERTLRAQAFDANHTLLYEGETTGVTILAGKMTAVTLTLQQVNAPPPFENAAPVITAVVANPGAVEPGGTVGLSATATDANPGDSMIIAWTAEQGSFASASSPATTWTAPQTPGPVLLTLSTTDSRGAQTTVSLTLMVRAATGSASVGVSFNTWPRVANISASSSIVDVNEALQLGTIASDDDGDALGYQWTSSCSGTWTHDNTANAQFTPTALPPAGAACASCALTVHVTDGRGGETTGTLSICVGPKTAARLPPEIVEEYQSVLAIPGSEPVTFRVKAVDPQDSALSFSWTASAGALGASVNGANTSEVLWTAPTCIPAGSPLTITATATNALGLSSSASFSLSGGTPCNKAAVSTIAAGQWHTVAMRTDGTVWTWGGNFVGQLGNGTTTDSGIPSQVQGLTAVSAIASGATHTVALKADGTLWAWGNNFSGQLGDGTTTPSSVPVQVQGLTNVTLVACGLGHTLALKADGTVWAWGSNSHGELGDGTTVDRWIPTQVQGLTDVIALSGGAHTVALKADGTVWAWGRNDYGAVGDGTTEDRTVPVQVQSLTGVTAISSGSVHNLALRQDGTVWTWGGNRDGELGDGTTTNRPFPAQVQGLTQVKAISGGINHSMVVREDGTVWAWGDNFYGHLGDGTWTDRGTPVQVLGLTQVKALVASMVFTVAVREDDTVWAWGSNDSGQLGDGTTTYRRLPVQVQGL